MKYLKNGFLSLFKIVANLQRSSVGTALPQQADATYGTGTQASHMSAVSSPSWLLQMHLGVLKYHAALHKYVHGLCAIKKRQR